MKIGSFVCKTIQPYFSNLPQASMSITEKNTPLKSGDSFCVLQDVESPAVSFHVHSGV